MVDVVLSKLSRAVLCVLFFFSNLSTVIVAYKLFNK